MSYNYDRWGFPTTVATFAPSGVRIKPTSQRCGLSGCGPSCIGCGDGLGNGNGSYVLSGSYHPLGVGLEGYNMEVGPSRLAGVQAGIAGGAQLRGLRGIWDTCGTIGDLTSSFAGMFTSSDSKSTSGTARDVQRYSELGSAICGAADAVDDRGGRRGQSADDAVAQARADAGGTPPREEPTEPSVFAGKNLLIGLVALGAGVGLGFFIAR